MRSSVLDAERGYWNRRSVSSGVEKGKCDILRKKNMFQNRKFSLVSFADVCLWLKAAHMHNISLTIQMWPFLCLCIHRFWMGTRSLMNSKVRTWHVRLGLLTKTCHIWRSSRCDRPGVWPGFWSPLVLRRFCCNLDGLCDDHGLSHADRLATKSAICEFEFFVFPFLAGCNPEIMSVCEVAVYFLSCINHYYILYY